MSNRVAVYAGSFDLFTIGHLWVAEQGSKMFDTLVIAVGVNPAKANKTMFTVEERLAQIRACTSHLPNVEVTSCGKMFLHDYVMSIDANWVLRGVRGPKDYEDEANTQDMVREALDKMKCTYDIQTAFIRPPHDVAVVSSSSVKALMGFDKWEEMVAFFVSPAIVNSVIAKFKEVLNANA
ncbi:pantetheine-phosphate adenylyltransferase [Candidatus Uhrbacteria bacterium RIFCSPHIGHO2_02_FULL_47_44]|uniref:Phosphopantetheine adenylyltransferase n=1 Tax=Candidatus Uhrbacteria bacterium RIFCSPLOWO2_02_FULL_48_18 TaxID=1802408 RepID=A0A1F7VCW3_9BACT|nr:MAG: pantetheine-phosphate adenylyltransferase [Candidatus Uhrbacteria bacterium RIFCSPHIGHO2_01_FULL_47_10]OGL71908.1 MAG: pantetheine-phosphate adenylyltransferase [Candidatus Uhrbacteria bacterium RIFCSPHIGHO2_02_FULL_47_44]OGL77736.1 MAG: pantetheine-phosphate adenylyltransferase [Candidatus Uhrbacteria bacterium RIFCSPHIGHO2_12_FULL_47_12]OGL80532.1 MAG: pantetheine-phosphate adenylyltransferase [Candidatus Uhrbacteria bacterium RIFCSPLOWO2_01_FULL_47_17]OGL88285.1 MAG: pantetheine-phos